MRYDKLQRYGDEEFRRLTGIKRQTFIKIVQILQAAEVKKKSRGGKPNILTMEDRLLMALEYLREYRTYFHVAASYGVSESSCYRNIRWIEDVLVKYPDFRLPGRKELLKRDVSYEVILVDATETPIERPKKDRSVFTQARKKDTL